MTTLPPLTPMKSTAISGHHYDPATRALTVQFPSGDVWRYDDVPMEKAEAFAGAASPGGFFGNKIKGLYHGRKL